MTNVFQLLKLLKAHAWLLLLLMKPKLSSLKWLVTTTDTLLSVLKEINWRLSKMALLKTIKMHNKALSLWTLVTQLDLDLLWTSQFSTMKLWTIINKHVNLVNSLCLTLLKRLMMLMRKPSEMPNPSLNSSKKTFLFGKKKKTKTTLRTCDDLDIVL